MSSDIHHSSDKQKLGFIALIAIIVSSMIGSGVDSLPQNMAAHSATGPVMIAWFISGFGMFFIAYTFVILSKIRPDLDSGIYMYSKVGFGTLIAFIVVWGYWLMVILSNVAFAIMVMDVLNYFLPGDFTGGNNLASLIGASLLIWGFNFLVLSGVHISGLVDTIGTVAKLIPLVIFVGIVCYFFNSSQFTDDFWGENHSSALGSLSSQIYAPLNVSLWCFIGIEGAVALSGRARDKSDIGKATLIGFIISLAICLFISILPFGTLSQTTLKNIATPSTAGVLKILVGNWGEWLINIGVLISVLSSWVAWTMICAEVPMVAGQTGTFPHLFAKKNRHDSASVSLWVGSFLMQLVVILIYFSHNAWLTLLSISSLTVLPAYFGSAAYLLKLCLTGEYRRDTQKRSYFAVFVSLIAIFFCLFMFYASDVHYVEMIPLLITAGLPLFFWAKWESKKRHPQHNLISKKELLIFIILIGLDLLTLYLIIE